MEVCSKNIEFFNMKPRDTQNSEEVLKFDHIHCDLLAVHCFYAFFFSVF